MRYALVSTGLVENVILWDGAGPEFANSFEGKQLLKLEEGSPVSPGWAYANGEFLAPQPAASAQPPVEVRIAVLRDRVQHWLDEGARNLGYDDIKTAVTYAEEPAVPKFQSEGQALRAWRSLVWEACYALLASWQAGNAEEPNAEQLIALMPVFQAPDQ